MNQIQIYTDSSFFEKDNIILDTEAFFNFNITSENFGSEEEKVIQEIDHAQLIDKNIGTIKTPRGITSIDSLSTGCKTVLVYLFLDKIKSTKAINISLCGANALRCLFNYIETANTQIPLVLMHKDNVYECGEHDYIINGEKHIKNLIYM